MKIRSYKGTSLEKLHAAITRELGPQAMIVHRGQAGLSRFLGKPRHELIAVAEDGAADSHLISHASQMPEWKKLISIQDRKFDALEATLERVGRELEQLGAGGAGQKGTADSPSSKLPPMMRSWDPRFVEKVRGQIPGLFAEEPSPDLADELGTFFPVQESFRVGADGRRPRVVAMTGPTGSGKTTTLSKLAAKWSLEDHLNVGVITADTYRIAAVDQIREYATLLGLEMKVVFSAGEARQAIESFRDKDVILADTPGRNFFDPVAMRGLRGILQAMSPLRTLLLTPATLERQTLRAVIRQHALLAPDAMVVTKIDEACSHDAFTVLAGETDCPIAFLTNGQRVPEDILPATRKMIAELVLYGMREERAAA